jgi:Ni/Fe-hydrogenase subunit HybB-like protein
MTAPARPAPVGGRLLTLPLLLLLAIAGVAGVLVVRRFALGLGATTALNDGYPWGLWIAFDVVTGTAFGCGGFAVALLVYVLNRGAYHPLVRPAILTSALGYSIAGFSVLLDLGRPWLAWKIPFFVADWNHGSVLLEVALCIMAYSLVLWIELSPAFLERAETSPWPRLRRLGAAWRPRVEGALLWITALGLLLPTMHQSSLGSLLLLSGPRLHPLWNTMLLPFLFLVSCIGMGYGAVVVESSLAAQFLGRRPHTEMLAGLGAAMLPVGGLYLAVRVTDLVVRGQVGALLAGDVSSVMSLLELALFTAPLVMLRSRARRRDPGVLFRAGMGFMLAGALYRFDVYLLAFRPGAHWTYFPSVSEILVTVGLVAGEIAAYVLLVKTFPILTGPARPAPAH